MAGLPYASDDKRDGVIGLSYAMRQVAQLLLMCDGHDIGISIGSSPVGRGHSIGGSPAGMASAMANQNQVPVDFDEPRVFVYDNYPGGIGFSEPLFRMHAGLIAKTHELIRECPCESGCPSCVGPLGQVGPLAKKVALDILGTLGAREQSATSNER
jgi:DEAD/DEAH box helicase domain-containing protein